MTRKQNQPSFEKQLAKLEQIVTKLDAEGIPLEKAIALYEEGVMLSKDLNELLARAQKRIEMLTREDGALTPKPFEEEETHAE